MNLKKKDRLKFKSKKAVSGSGRIRVSVRTRAVTGVGNWHTSSMKDTIPVLHLSDGPHGLRAQEDGNQINDSIEATCFPTASCSACSWDPDLLGLMGQGIAREARAEKVSVVLGPGANMKRSPLCGRNFEYFSEDPYLAGAMAAAWIKGAQSQGVGTSLKHFAANNQETCRMQSDSRVDERTLHELYLPAFEQAVKKAKPATIMASYNRVNGVHACENYRLLTEILRESWGFEGLVVSDWGACVDLPACLEAGLDLDMPDSYGSHSRKLQEALDQGDIDPGYLDRAVARLTALAEQYGPQEGDKEGISRELRLKNHRLSERIAEESAVLLKNDGILPLKEGSQVAVIGGLAYNARFQGGGSSHINTEHVSDLFEQLERCNLEYADSLGYDIENEAPDPDLEEEALKLVKKAAQKGIPVLFFGGLTDRTEGEGFDRESFKMPENQLSLLEKVLSITGNVIFISFSGSPYDLAPAMAARAILQMYLAGECTMAACARLLTGKANPCGKLAETWPLSMEDVPSYGYFARQGLASERPFEVEYREGIFAGYRYYDTYNKPVRYSFGFGKSYSHFALSLPRMEVAEACLDDFDCLVKVKVDVTNTSLRTGKEVVQVYVKNPDQGFLRPTRILAGFAKVQLAPGESKTLEIHLPRRAFQVWKDDTMEILSPEAGEGTETDLTGFVTVEGDYKIEIGNSLDNLILKNTIHIDGIRLKGNERVPGHIPMTAEEFRSMCPGSYDYPGQNEGYSMKSSINQLAETSLQAKALRQLMKTALKRMTKDMPKDDPAAVMMREFVLDGSVDCIISQSGGMIPYGYVEYLIRLANKKDR